MTMTDAERQARYRARQRERAGEPVEAAVERERQAIFADWIDQLQGDDSPESVAVIRDVAARPARTGEAFRDWLIGLLNRDIEDEIAVARRERARAKKARRRAPGISPA